MSRSIIVEESKIQEILQDLNREFSVSGDGIDVAKTKLQAILQVPTNAEVQKPLEFKQVVEHKQYRFRLHGAKHDHLDGKLVTVIKKNRTRIKVRLDEQAGAVPINTIYTVNPSVLVEV